MHARNELKQLGKKTNKKHSRATMNVPIGLKESDNLSISDSSEESWSISEGIR